MRPAHSAADVLARLGEELPQGPSDPVAVVDALVEAVGAGLTATGSPRFFGYVIGGTLPAALAADLLAVVWDQNAALASLSPAASAVEQVAGRWVRQLLGLPADASVGFTTGTQMAHVTALAAARHRVLADVGWDVAALGLIGAPPIRVLAGADRHTTVDAALRLLGFGSRSIVPVAADALGRMRPEALRAALAALGGVPTIIIAQAGEINTGSADPLRRICDLAREYGAWVHVDGAFGLWAAVSGSARRRHLVAGAADADSWATDGHKWLNVPYDCGIAIVADRAAHRAAMTAPADYFPPDRAGALDPVDWTPEFSRRARALAVYAALRSLGRTGLRDLVDRCCDLAGHAAARLAQVPGVQVLNAVDDSGAPVDPGGLANRGGAGLDDPHHVDDPGGTGAPGGAGILIGISGTTHAVPLNQVLLRVEPLASPSDDGVAKDGLPEGGDPVDPREVGDRLTRAVTTTVTAGGEAYLTGTVWRGRAAMRLSVSNWSTTRADVDRAVDVIAAAVDQARRTLHPPGRVVPSRDRAQ
ncbi:putative amino acid decarboxylase, Pyridoxal-dependent protein [Frankia sp. AiPs1]|uniref:pyridoxal phosphate-dependent decarboxylase family protein n=1 Tax=Frankia sp. AiPa1 TaxID=573492 RepID=UPI00202AD29C|nr:pyridoxal-dependent decarboxylase [Frankia sp. AiPa1]MCL9759187.1 pyridoxal-dependent decarboxylase [Frankia sp. AiPa1]